MGDETRIPSPDHYTLGELIARLREEPDQTRKLKLGFSNPHSYRGYYQDVAFEIASDVTVAEMLACAEWALGRTFHGWKGGDFTMADYTDTWLVQEAGTSCGETLGAVMLALMLGEANAAGPVPVDVWAGLRERTEERT